jgi:hypothetical protein
MVAVSAIGRRTDASPQLPAAKNPVPSATFSYAMDKTGSKSSCGSGAVRAAARAFNAVDDSVNDLLTVTAEGTPAHAQLTKLRLSLQTLLARYATHTPVADPILEPPPAAPSTPVTPATPNPGGSPFVE